MQETVIKVVWATSACDRAHVRFRDMTYANQFAAQNGGELTMLDDEALTNPRTYSLEVVEDCSAKDSVYCGKLGPMLHAFQKLRGLV